MLDAWNNHRHKRVAKVVEFTTKNERLRKASPHFHEQPAKEWVVVAMDRYTGPEAGVQWMYESDAESIKAESV